MLLTSTDGLHPATAAGIQRLGVGRAVLLGGTAASTQVEADLAALGITNLTRLAGGDRNATAARMTSQNMHVELAIPTLLVMAAFPPYTNKSV